MDQIRAELARIGDDEWRVAADGSRLLLVWEPGDSPWQELHRLDCAAVLVGLRAVRPIAWERDPNREGQYRQIWADAIRARDEIGAAFSGRTSAGGTGAEMED
jgi:hypothetical protein